MKYELITIQLDTKNKGDTCRSMNRLIESPLFLAWLRSLCTRQGASLMKSWTIPSPERYEYILFFFHPAELVPIWSETCGEKEQICSSRQNGHSSFIRSTIFHRSSSNWVIKQMCVCQHNFIRKTVHPIYFYYVVNFRVIMIA